MVILKIASRRKQSKRSLYAVPLVSFFAAVMAQAKSGVSLPSLCNLPKETGPCRASIRRYFYNKDTEECEQFTYGGCRGNENNFETKEACEETCKPRW